MSASLQQRSAALGGRPGGEARARLLLRPLLRVRRISLFEREVRERLSRAALDLVFAAAATMSEGQRSLREGRELFFGSTMLTVELDTLTPAVRDACDACSAQRMAALLATDSGALARIRGIAAEEAERLGGTRPGAVSTEIRVSARGTTVYIDVDVEADLSGPLGMVRPGAALSTPLTQTRPGAAG
jgi:hypothetical protein